MVPIKTNDDWDAYYLKHKPSLANILLHWQYLLSILLSNPKNILEIGCGPASHSIFIKRILPSLRLSLLDQDTALLAKIKNKYKKKISAVHCIDLLSKDFGKINFDKPCVVISQGLMEHFGDKEFIEVVNNFQGKAEKMIFSVPSAEYPTKDFGNENLRSKQEVISLLNDIEGINFKVKRYFDIGIRTKIIAIQKRKLSIFKALKYILFGSNHLLIKIIY